MSGGGQGEFPFASLDFSGRGAVTLGEVAKKLGLSVPHLVHFVEDGRLRAIDFARHTGSRRTLRVALEDYHAFVLARVAGRQRAEFLSHLPVPTLRELLRDIEAKLKEAA
jgi:hypothetical protein